jgi:hypothetical protein
MAPFQRNVRKPLQTCWRNNNLKDEQQPIVVKANLRAEDRLAIIGIENLLKRNQIRKIKAKALRR